ncbi:hypothetical protein V6N11_061057 [Hibiscus sabdariffa]|uniref:Cytochrome P450 n=1 Tax=Hibiscus sabdariffa TaxID=183260 RepID=A0ABR2QS50_9ROSI
MEIGKRKQEERRFRYLVTKFQILKALPNSKLEVEREVQLGKLVLPANIDLLIPNMTLQHDPHLWGGDVHLFKPERFAEGIARATKYNSAAFFPFGLGPRSCVGMTFATTETKIALYMILQRYTFTLSPAYATHRCLLSPSDHDMEFK